MVAVQQDTQVVYRALVIAAAVANMDVCCEFPSQTIFHSIKIPDATSSTQPWLSLRQEEDDLACSVDGATFSLTCIQMYFLDTLS